MADGILGNAVGAFGFPKTYILTDSDGNELIGTYVENLTVFDANPETDIREGKTAVTDDGVVIGSAIIPNYEYIYAKINPDLNMCIGIYTGTCSNDNPNWIEIPEYNAEYMFKYYNMGNEKWYYDEGMTQEFIL